MKRVFIFLLAVYFLVSPVCAIELRSPAFGTQGEIPYLHTCQDSQDLSIPLSWSDVPIATGSFAIIMEEQGGANDRTHWVIYNIPASTRQLNPGIIKVPRLPDGSMQGVNDFEVTGYSGPCPKGAGASRYAITIYALDTMLVLKKSPARKEDIIRAMRGHIIGQYRLTGQYARLRQ